MELSEYLRILRKRVWVIVLIAALMGGAAYAYGASQKRMYTASVMISVGGYIQSPNPNATEIRTGVELAQTYAILAKTYDILKAAVDNTNATMPPEELQTMVMTQVVTNTSLLRMSVTYDDPVMAAVLANEIARQLILNSPSNLTPEQQNQLDQANAVIARLSDQLEKLNAQVTAIDRQLEADVVIDEGVRQQLLSQKSGLIEQINLATANQAQFFAIVSDLQERSNSLEIIELARVPTKPSGTSPITLTVFGVIVGVVSAAGLALLWEVLDDVIRLPEEVTEVLTLPVLASIPRFGSRRMGYHSRLVTLDNPRDPVAERYLSLRSKLLFAASRHASKSYVFTSSGLREGKSLTVANLAVAMAMADLNVLLIDCDLRQPKQHQIFGLHNDLGLTALLTVEPPVLGDYENRLEMLQDFNECVQEPVKGLRVLTSGEIPHKPAETLGSIAMQRWVQVFQNADDVDVILFDTPPALAMSDAAVLAATTGAPIVLVIRAGKTRRKIAQETLEQLRQFEVDLRGVVLNYVKPRDLGAEYRMYYGSGYTIPTNPLRQNGNLELTPADRQRVAVEEHEQEQ
jgi:non-specific protein-tyrosine kinase